jgi:hypothetical protein
LLWENFLKTICQQKYGTEKKKKAAVLEKLKNIRIMYFK